LDWLVNNRDKLSNYQSGAGIALSSGVRIRWAQGTITEKKELTGTVIEILYA
jgi:hypothetical protein